MGYTLADCPVFTDHFTESTIGTRTHSSSEDRSDAQDAFKERICTILNTDLPIKEETGALEQRILPLGRKARKLLIQFSDQVERDQSEGSYLAAHTAWASKAAEHAVRIAAVLTLWRDLNASEVVESEMSDGIAITKYYLSETVRLKEARSVSKEVGAAEKVRVWLMEKFEFPEITLSEVYQLGPNCVRKMDAAKATMKVLEDHGWVIPLPRETLVRGAKRKDAWRIFKG